MNNCDKTKHKRQIILIFNNDYFNKDFFNAISSSHKKGIHMDLDKSNRFYGLFFCTIPAWNVQILVALLGGCALARWRSRHRCRERDMHANCALTRLWVQPQPQTRRNIKNKIQGKNTNKNEKPAAGDKAKSCPKSQLPLTFCEVS